MEYYSTRDASLRCSLKEAAIMGLAPDGGLFMPERIPSADLDEVMSCGTFLLIAIGRRLSLAREFSLMNAYGVEQVQGLKGLI